MPEPLRDDAELRAWDWRAELEAQQRSIAWLARQTGYAESTAYKFASGRETPSIDWLRSAAKVLGRAVAA